MWLSKLILTGAGMLQYHVAEQAYIDRCSIMWLSKLILTGAGMLQYHVAEQAYIDRGWNVAVSCG